MSIYCNNECLKCIHYLEDKDAVIYKLQLIQYESRELKVKENKILFVLHGNINFSLDQYSKKTISTGEMTLIPPGSVICIEAIRDCEIVILEIPTNILVCHCISITKLSDSKATKANPGPSILKMNKDVSTFLSIFSIYKEENLNCSLLYECKIRELLFILKKEYEDIELYDFFYLSLTDNISFLDFVYQNYKKVKTVKELATLANSSTSTFQRHFILAFGKSPNKWIQEQKADSVLKEIRNNTKNIKEICADHGFYSPAHLHNFCKKHFGLSPKQMREKNKYK